MDRKETRNKLAELKTLAKCAKQNIYRRTRLASEILADGDWLAEQHDGDA